MSLDTAFQAALDGDFVGMFCGVQIDHPNGTAHLLDGSGVLSFNGATWTGGDDVFGSLGSLDVVSDGSDQEAPAIKLGLLPPNAAAAIALCIPGAQGALVRIYIGCFDPATGAVIGTPDLRFLGEIDVATPSFNGEQSMVVFDVTTAFERFFDLEEGAVLSDGFHQNIWPGELGFEYMTNIFQKMPWGQDGQRPAVIVTKSK